MTYQKTIDYLFSQLPMFQRKGEKAFNPNLDRSIALCNYLNNPENKFKSVHIAGTNGKGSTSHMLASILQEAGYKVGLYTSPHLKDFRERIKINGKPIHKNSVINFVKKHKQFCEQLQPSFFEMTVAMAFDYFANQKVDIAVIEVGLGGRFDSTNLITPLVSVITNIGYDHVNILGDTLPKIAFEKAGIIKQNVPVVISETHKETASVFKKKAKETNSNITFADKEIKLLKTEQIYDSKPILKVKTSAGNYNLDLSGTYQSKNLLAVLKTVNELQNIGWKITEKQIKKGLTNTIANTGLLGRWQVLQQQPLVICEASHNEDGIKQTLQQLKNIDYSNLHIVIGMVADKDISKILKLLPKKANYYYCNAKLERALIAKELAEQANTIGLKGEAYDSCKQALLNAKNATKTNDLVLVTGSIFVIAEVI